MDTRHEAQQTPQRSSLTARILVGLLGVVALALVGLVVAAFVELHDLAENRPDTIRFAADSAAVSCAVIEGLSDPQTKKNILALLALSEDLHSADSLGEAGDTLFDRGWGGLRSAYSGLTSLRRIGAKLRQQIRQMEPYDTASRELREQGLKLASRLASLGPSDLPTLKELDLAPLEKAANRYANSHFDSHASLAIVMTVALLAARDEVSTWPLSQVMADDSFRSAASHSPTFAKASRGCLRDPRWPRHLLDVLAPFHGAGLVLP